MITAMVTRIGSKRSRTYIRLHREAKNWSQQELADRMDTTKASISRYEKWEAGFDGGDVREPDFETIQHLNHILGTDVRYHPDKPSADYLLRDASKEAHNRAIEVLRAMLGRKAS